MRVPEQPPEPPALGRVVRDGRLVPLSRRGQTLLKGHALKHEGAAYTASGQFFDRYGRLGGPGYAMCECGAMSPTELPSAAARKRWHRDHKDRLR